MSAGSAGRCRGEARPAASGSWAKTRRLAQDRGAGGIRSACSLGRDSHPQAGRGDQLEAAGHLPGRRPCRGHSAPPWLS